MPVEPIKKFFIDFKGPIATVYGLIGASVTIAVALADINKWIFAIIAIISILVSVIFLYLYVKKSSNYRTLDFRFNNTISIFHQTHNTWHIYKRLSDSLHKGFDLDEIRQLLHTDILNLVSNLRDSFGLFHPNVDFSVSIKAFSYKTPKALNAAKGEDYINLPFTLIDLPLYRDSSQGAIKKSDVVHNLDFDETTNKGEINNLKETLFYKAFESKTVKYANKFSGVQQSYTNRFKSGLCAPIIFHDIPFMVICIGCKEFDIFSKEDHNLACTFADAISEFIRLERIFNSIAKTKKVIVMGDLTELLEKLEKESLKEKQIKGPGKL